MRALLLSACFLVLACGAGAAEAKVYKCPLPGGGHEYRQIACDGEGSGEVKVNDPTVSRRTGTNTEPEAVDASVLVGDWCEFGVSTELDSERVDEAFRWYFGSDYVTYMHTRSMMPIGSEPPKFPLRRDGAVFYVDDDLFGGSDAAWTVVGRRAGVVFVEGPMGGILHMRPGRC